MARSKNPYYSIASLKGLEYLYRLTNNIQSKPGTNRYIEEIQKHLHSDSKKIGVKSRNFVMKFINEPGEIDLNEVTGIDLDVLDDIVKKVFQSSKINELFPKINMNTEPYPSSVFEDIIFPSPSHYERFKNKKYYQYLDAEEKSSIDAYVQRRLYELGIPNPNFLTYSVYQWSIINNSAQCGILIINKEKLKATYSYFHPDQSGTPKGVLECQTYTHDTNLLSIPLVHEDPDKRHIRANFFLSILDSEMSKLRFIKGVLSGTSQNGVGLFCSEVVLEYHSTYSEAYKNVTDAGSRTQALCLEVVNRRLEATGNSSYDLKNFRNYKLYRNLEAIKGFYFMGFITQGGSDRGIGMLSTAICHIKTDGTVDIRVNNEDDEYKGYINQAIPRDDSVICIDYFLKNAGDLYDAQYRLEILRDPLSGAAVRGFAGTWHAFIYGTIYKDSMVMIKIDCEDESLQYVPFYGYRMVCRKFEDINEVEKTFKLRTRNLQKGDELHSLEDACVKLLQKKIHTLTVRDNSNEQEK